MSEAVVEELRALQKIAGAFSQALPADQSVITLRVVLVVDAKYAWKLIETTRSPNGRRRRHMLSFRSLDAIQRAIGSYLAWQHADKQLFMTHMETSGGFAGVTTDWVPSTLVESFFAALRDSIRRDLCTMSVHSTAEVERQK